MTTPSEPTSPDADEPAVTRTSASSRFGGRHSAAASGAAETTGEIAATSEIEASGGPETAEIAGRPDTAAAVGDAEATEASGDTPTDPGSAVGDENEAPEGEEAAAAAAGRKRRIIIAAAVVGVLVVVLVALLLTRGGRQDPITVVTVTAEAASPSPQTDPIERDTSTALLEALPGTVLGYAVSEQTESEEMLAAHALEGWALTYSDGDASVLLQVGQWPDGAEAKAAWEALVGDAAPVASGDVVVGDDTVGNVVTVVDGDVERTIWRNRTAVFVAQGPVGATQAFYDGFPF